MRRPVRDAIALAILLFLTLGIGALDCISGRNASLWFLHLLPVGLAAAIGGGRAGLAFSVLATALVVAVGARVGHPFPSPTYFYFEVFGYLFAYLITVGLALGIRERLHRGIGELLPSAEATEELRRVVARQREGSGAGS